MDSIKPIPHLFILILLSLVIYPVTSAAAQSDTEADVMAVINRFFHAFAERDSARMAAEVDMDGRLVITAFTPDGAPFIRPIPMRSFIPSIANRQGPPIEETIWNPVVEIHDNLATVWVEYNLWVGDAIDHCGKDAFQLARFPADADEAAEAAAGEAAWKIIAVADTQRREGCTDRGLRR